MDRYSAARNTWIGRNHRAIPWPSNVILVERFTIVNCHGCLLLLLFSFFPFSWRSCRWSRQLCRSSKRPSPVAVDIGCAQSFCCSSCFYSIVSSWSLFHWAIIIESITFNGHMVCIVVQHYLFLSHWSLLFSRIIPTIFSMLKLLMNPRWISRRCKRINKKKHTHTYKACRRSAFSPLFSFLSIRTRFSFVCFEILSRRVDRLQS